MKKNRIEYCRECGSKLIEELVGAELYEMGHPYLGIIRPFGKYDEETGKRQYIKHKKCPNLRFWNRHDEEYEQGIITL